VGGTRIRNPEPSIREKIRTWEEKSYESKKVQVGGGGDGSTKYEKTLKGHNRETRGGGGKRAACFSTTRSRKKKKTSKSGGEGPFSESPAGQNGKGEKRWAKRSPG